VASVVIIAFAYRGALRRRHSAMPPYIFVAFKNQIAFPLRSPRSPRPLRQSFCLSHPLAFPLRPLLFLCVLCVNLFSLPVTTAPADSGALYIFNPPASAVADRLPRAGEAGTWFSGAGLARCAAADSTGPLSASKVRLPRRTLKCFSPCFAVSSRNSTNPARQGRRVLHPPCFTQGGDGHDPTSVLRLDCGTCPGAPARVSEKLPVRPRCAQAPKFHAPRRTYGGLREQSAAGAVAVRCRAVALSRNS
jgi:hypothetical protein